MGEEIMAEGATIFQIISYIVTVVIGGVGYKYLQLWLGHKKDNTYSEREGNQLLITNLQERINQITVQLNSLEEERKEQHEREIVRVREVVQAQADVRILQERIKYLEESMGALKIVIKAYENKFGILDEKA